MSNRRRGDWNALLLVMFALLAVAPSVLSAAPLRAGVSQPQAVWQWLQSPEGAPTRDLLARSLDLEHFPNLPPDQWANILCQCGITSAECGVQLPSVSHASPIASHLNFLSVAEPVSTFDGYFLRIPHSALRTPQHEAAFRSGTRTNSYLE